MKKEDLKNLCTDFGIKTGNFKKNDLILLIVDYQRNMINEQENDSDISSITDVQEENSVDTSISFTSLKTTPIGILDGEDIDIEEIDVIEDDITSISSMSISSPSSKLIGVVLRDV